MSKSQKIVLNILYGILAFLLLILGGIIYVGYISPDHENTNILAWMHVNTENKNIATATPVDNPTSPILPTPKPSDHKSIQPGTTWYGQIIYKDGTAEQVTIAVDSVNMNQFSGTFSVPAYGTSTVISGQTSDFTADDKARLNNAIVRDDAVQLGEIVFRIEKSVRGIPAATYYLKNISGNDFDNELQGNFYYPDNTTTQPNGTLITDKKRFQK